ncbi:tripartite-type tricarboxylate transporter receptor subunit TctC [Acidovorax soli]|uniref:Tripartite-type tricarboxylate transporter receptor subunit TctC n=2 Tax=Acidovorax soli TaxID=592050 RepID=A0A7X0PL64_9BURK|nr:tripartite-type tricarboxylate transporter receptor subunit TctC [Acidovorax soli]
MTHPHPPLPARPRTGRLPGLAVAAAMAVAVGSLAAAPAARAQAAYPTKPVRLIVPFAAGGTTDIIARVVASGMGAALGQPLVVDNKSGAGGALGTQELARQAADGHALAMATVSTTAAAPAINPKVGYDPRGDFTPIINIAATPNVIAVHPGFGARDYKAFVQRLKTEPGKHSYATAGTGSIGHMQMELFKSLSGAFITHIPYRGSGPALNDTVAGQVPIVFDNLPSALPFIQSGQLVPIVVAAPQRLAQLPGVPTFKEVGLDAVNRMAFYGIVGPKGLPRPVVDKVAAAVRQAAERPEVKKRIEDTGSQLILNTPEQFATQIRAEYGVYRQVVQAQKLSMD